jgi:hypothetical protein
MQVDQIPGRGPTGDSGVNRVRGNFSEKNYEACREAARKILSSNVQLTEILNAQDPKQEGLVSREVVIEAIEAKKVSKLQRSELELLTRFCDQQERDFIVIPAFTQKLNDIAQETP